MSDRRRCFAALALLAASTLGASGCVALAPPREWFRTRADAGSASLSPAPSRRESLDALEVLEWGAVVELALERNPTLARASAAIAAAEAVLAREAALAYPRLDGRASWIRFYEAANFRGRTGSDVSGASTRTRFFTGRGSEIYSGGIDATYPLFDGGDVYYARRAASAGVRASRADEVAARRDLELAVSEVFLDLLLARGAISIAEDSLAFALREEERARVREDAGEGLKIDTLRFGTRASEDRLALNRARGAQRALHVALGELLDLRLGDSVRLIDPTEAVLVPAGDRVAIALRTRPELLAVSSRLDGARETLEREKASWSPAVSVFGSYGAISLDKLRLSRAKDELQIGTAMSINIFEGGAMSARVAAAREAVRGIGAERRELALRVEREVREAEIALEVASENVEVSKEGERLATLVLDQERDRFAAGATQSLDVNQAELSRTTARLVALRSQVNLLRSQARLRHAMGLRSSVVDEAAREE